MKITSLNNRYIKDTRSLYKKKDRMDKGLFIVEGMKMIEEALDMSYPLKYIFYTKSLEEIRNGREFYKRVSGLDNSIEVSEEVFYKISDTETPQGVIGLAELKIRKLDGLEVGKNDRYILLDGLQDPGNMGTIIRSADAFNLDGIIIKSGTVDPFNPKVVRASMGSIFRIPIYYLERLNQIEMLKECGFRIMATSLKDSKDIKDVKFANTIVVVGNESQGVSDEIFNLSDEFIKIPMPGYSESLNAGVAASIIMYESIK